MPFSPDKPRARRRIENLAKRFDRYVDYFDQHVPFTREQLQAHLDTIGRRRSFAKLERALADEAFIRSLYRTLRYWGLGIRGSELLDCASFCTKLRDQAPVLLAFEDVKLEEVPEAESLSQRLWDVIADFGITRNQNPVVAGTKCLHHLLPDLVPPMDRKYTQAFFGWGNPEFQYNAGDCFRHAFQCYAGIARRVRPSRLIGEGWRSSGPKIVDNAVVGYCLAEGLVPRGGVREPKSGLRSLGRGL